MPQVFEAIFENGVLRPATPLLGLSEGQRVQVVMEQPASPGDAVQKEADLIRRLEARGLLDKTIAPSAPADFRPLNIPGPGLSETILAERR